MKISFKNIEKFFDSEKLKLDQKYITFFFFLVLSGIFWLLNVLNKNTDTVISYPVRYINFPNRKVLVGDLPSRLLIKIEAPGYTLLKYKMAPPIKPLVFNVKALSLQEEKDTLIMQKYYVLTDYLKDNIQRQLSSEIRLIDIFPDSLIFNFARIVHKTVPVVTNIKLTIDKPFMLKSKVQPLPDSISISGPQFIVDTIKFVKTKFQHLKNANGFTQRNLALENIKNIVFSQRRIIVKVPVEQFTESNLAIPITVKNLPDSLVLKTFPRSVSVSCLVALSDYEKLNAELFDAYVDYNSIENTYPSKIKVRLESYPEYIKLLKYYPINVDYIIEK